MAVVGLLWPVMTAIFLAGTFVILIFPFYTYIQSSGLIGEQLPKVRPVLNQCIGLKAPVRLSAGTPTASCPCHSCLLSSWSLTDGSSQSSIIGNPQWLSPGSTRLKIA